MSSTHSALDPAAAPMITVMVADGRQIVRTGIRSLLGAARDIVVVAEASTGDQALARAREATPQVAILAQQLSGEDGLTILRRLRLGHPQLAVMVTANQPRAYCWTGLKTRNIDEQSRSSSASR